jgi:hypothetical protein
MPSVAINRAASCAVADGAIERIRDDMHFLTGMRGIIVSLQRMLRLE